MSKEVKETKVEETKYTKAQIILSEKFRHNIDLVRAMLDEDKTYTIKEVSDSIESYLSKKL